VALGVSERRKPYFTVASYKKPREYQEAAAGAGRLRDVSTEAQSVRGLKTMFSTAASR